VGEVEHERREGWEQAVRALGAGFLARWDRHDPEALEQAVRTLAPPTTAGSKPEGVRVG
jgi:hypothetical protein